MSEKAPATGIKVLVKAMDILNLLGSERSAELPLGEIAERLDLNKSTCHHILHTLTLGNYVERTSPGRYKLGVKIFQVGSQLLAHMDVRERAAPIMSEVQRTTGETVFLYIQRGDEAVCVERLDGHYSSTHLLRVGDALPLHVGASPKVFLASQPDVEIEHYIERAALQASGRYPLDQRQLWRDIAELRASDFVVSSGDIESVTNAVGSPIRDHTGAVVGGISISWVKALSDNSAEELRTVVLDASAKISLAMGHTPREPAKKGTVS